MTIDVDKNGNVVSLDGAQGGQKRPYLTVASIGFDRDSFNAAIEASRNKSVSGGLPELSLFDSMDQEWECESSTPGFTKIAVIEFPGAMRSCARGALEDTELDLERPTRLGTVVSLKQDSQPDKSFEQTEENDAPPMPPTQRVHSLIQRKYFDAFSLLGMYSKGSGENSLAG